MTMMLELERLGLFRQNTYLQNKKHMLTCQVGLVVIDLITSPVVSWRGCETPPQYRGSAVILCSTTVVRGPLFVVACCCRLLGFVYVWWMDLDFFLGHIL